MTEAQIHLLRGDDAHGIALWINKFIISLGESFDPSMNLSRLDGNTTNFDNIQLAISTLPFFTGDRLVILENAIEKIDTARIDSYTAMLSALPPTTQLVLLVEDRQKWRKTAQGWERVWETLTPTHWLVKWLCAQPKTEIVDLGLPDARQMDTWILNEAKRQGGKIEPAAANELTRHTANDTSIASQEIAKLLMYVNFQRAVTRQDVLELVSDEGAVDVFEMLDRLLEGKTSEAQGKLHRLLDNASPEVILGSFVHRFRQLILISEALESGGDIADLARKTGIFANKIENYRAAAQRIGMTKLEAMYKKLLEFDVQSKTSAADLSTNLELFILETGICFEK